jgi:hypothetical protein
MDAAVSTAMRAAFALASFWAIQPNQSSVKNSVLGQFELGGLARNLSGERAQSSELEFSQNVQRRRPDLEPLRYRVNPKSEPCALPVYRSDRMTNLDPESQFALSAPSLHHCKPILT